MMATTLPPAINAVSTAETRHSLRPTLSRMDHTPANHHQPPQRRAPATTNPPPQPTSKLQPSLHDHISSPALQPQHVPRVSARLGRLPANNRRPGCLARALHSSLCALADCQKRHPPPAVSTTWTRQQIAEAQPDQHQQAVHEQASAKQWPIHPSHDSIRFRADAGLGLAGPHAALEAPPIVAAVVSLDMGGIRGGAVVQALSGRPLAAAACQHDSGGCR
jgi:hypothetical protein